MPLLKFTLANKKFNGEELGTACGKFFIPLIVRWNYNCGLKAEEKKIM